MENKKLDWHILMVAKRNLLALTILLFPFLIYLSGCVKINQKNSSYHTTPSYTDSIGIVLINRDSINLAIAKSPTSKFIREAGITGTVISHIYINDNGIYQRHVITKSPHPLTSKAIEELIPSMQFKINQSAANKEADGLFEYEFRFKFTSL